mmetsp:Transcript_109714/g.306785  ORF Transcript_109714/g.306785 Transcript_109714/m.306785 type:complete len:236 (+) Transcript_109714:247-954(+)
MGRGSVPRQDIRQGGLEGCSAPCALGNFRDAVLGVLWELEAASRVSLGEAPWIQGVSPLLDVGGDGSAGLCSRPRVPSCGVQQRGALRHREGHLAAAGAPPHGHAPHGAERSAALGPGEDARSGSRGARAAPRVRRAAARACALHSRGHLVARVPRATLADDYGRPRRCRLLGERHLRLCRRGEAAFAQLHPRRRVCRAHGLPCRRSRCARDDPEGRLTTDGVAPVWRLCRRVPG